MTPLKRKRPRPGDVGLVKVRENAFARIHYIGKHPYLDDTVLVDPNLISEVGERIDTIERDPWLVFYQFCYFVRTGYISLIAEGLPEVPVPTHTRSPQRTGPAPWAQWVIHDGADGRTIRDHLSPEERALPEHSVITHGLLLERLDQHWSLSDDVA